MIRDLARRERVIEGEIKSGSVFINDSVPSRLPSTGVKESGCGRKLSSYGVEQFVNIKTVVVAYPRNDQRSHPQFHYPKKVKT